MAEHAWSVLLGNDPVPWLLSGEEPAARWRTLTGVLDLPADDPGVQVCRAEAVADASTADLLARLGDWEAGAELGSHASPAFAPNLLLLLADGGLREDDDPRLATLLASMLDHQEPSGRFPSFAPPRRGDPPVWGALLCDSHAVVEAAVRLGHADDRRVRAAVNRLLDDVAQTSQGPAWPCLPHPVTGFRGPGRRGDVCPQVTASAVRVLSMLDLAEDVALDAARVLLRAWRQRATEQPYMFGHGRSFKTVTWPVTWYGILPLLDTLGRYPQLWRGPDARGEDRRSLAELAACLVAYNVDPDGRVTPRSVRRGFEAHSFGQKRRPSPFATATLLAVLHRLDDLAPDAARVDVMALPSSKGGSGTARPPARPGPVRRGVS